MKTNITTLLCVVVSLVFFACNNDDDNTPPQNDPAVELPQLPPDFFPVSSNNYWSYRIFGADTNAIDSLYVNTVNDDTFTLAVDSNIGSQNGFMMRMLTDGVLTKQGTSLTLDSSFDFNLGLLNNETINFEGLVLYDTSVAIGETFFTTTGSYQDDLQRNPITVNYTLTSKNLGELDSLTFDLIPYPDIEVTEIVLEISVSIEVDADGTPTTVLLLEPQDLLQIETYYSADIGLVKSGTIFYYVLNYPTLELLNSLDIDWIIEPNGSNVILEEMKSHFVEN